MESSNTTDTYTASLEQRLAVLTAERDSLRSTAERLSSERDTLRTEAVCLSQELQGLRSSAARLSSERDALQGVAQLQQEREYAALQASAPTVVSKRSHEPRNRPRIVSVVSFRSI